MKKESSPATRAKSVAVILLFAAAAVLSAFTMGKIAINYNLADYLGEDTETKIALDIIEDEFGMTGSIQVMAKNVSPETAEEIQERIEAIPNVTNVDFDRYDEASYRDGNALFLIVVDGDDYSDEALQVMQDLEEVLSSYDGLEYGGTAMEKKSLRDSITEEMVYILAISLCLVVAILLITSESWAEPFVLLIASGVAVLLNRGTNFFFGEISYITNSISAILQLALSIDYSIVLLHAYRREKQNCGNRGYAMKRAILSVVKPVSASALTTMAGLLALLFMSFRIGFDIGIVLMKGIVISAITSLTLLPALVLLCDRLLTRTAKKAFAPKGRVFCKLAYKIAGDIVPIALIVMTVCGLTQIGNTYLFSDTNAGNTAITDVFGNHNTVVAVYPNSDDDFANEQKLAEALAAYRTADGAGVLSGYTAYTNTVRESYDVEQAVHKLGISEEDAKLLFTMYNLYRNPEAVRLPFADFMRFAKQLAETDPDAAEFVSADTLKTLQTVATVDEVLAGEWTAEELHEKLTTGALEGTDLDLFSIRQLYGLYFYDTLEEQSVDFRTMLTFLIAASENPGLSGSMTAETAAQLTALSQGIGQFEEQMQTRMTQEMFRGFVYQNTGAVLTESETAQLYAAYFFSQGAEQQETAPLLPLLRFALRNGLFTDPNAAATVASYAALDDAICGAYPYEEFLPALANIAAGLTGETPAVAVGNGEMQQLYIAWFYQTGALGGGKIGGSAFVAYALEQDGENEVIHARLSDENRNRLTDMLTLDGYLSATPALTYRECFEKLETLRDGMKSDMAMGALDEAQVSGVCIKYAMQSGGLTEPMMAYELLDFVSGSMDSNTLLMQRMSAENREKVADAQSDIAKAEELFRGKSHSRMLLSVDLPNEGEETTAFVRWLSGEVKEIFRDGAAVTGEIVSTYDLEKSFDHDNRFITVFTLISIFVIVLLVFRSLSLPVILVAVIQGAIFIAMATQIASGGIFFMSYIVSTCILMGATIDYGILMSSGYVANRQRYDKREALRMSVEGAMPTVFTSGLILTVCGFVIHFVSGQNSISTVGLLIGIGTISSVVMITVVLPSVLYLLDGFVLKLSAKRKSGEA